MTSHGGERHLRRERSEADLNWSDQDAFTWSEPRSRRSASHSGSRDEAPSGRRPADEPASTRRRVSRTESDEAAASEASAASAAPVPPAAPVPASHGSEALTGEFAAAVASFESRHARREAAAPGPSASAAAPATPAPATAGTPRPAQAPHQAESSAVRADAQAERRTVVIRGRGQGNYQRPSRRGYESRLKPHERTGFKPDRVALWAVLLGLALLLGAVTSSHAATLPAGLAHPGAAHHPLLVHMTHSVHHLREAIQVHRA